MKRTIPIAVLAAALLAAAAQKAHALWLEVHLTPKNLSFQEHTFTVTAADRDSQKQFQVTVAPKAKPISPFVLVQIDVNTSDHHFATVPVEVKREAGKLTCWFRLAPESLANSRFEIHESFYTVARDAQGNPQRDAQGNPKTEIMMGGTYYWFHPAEFLGTSAADPSRR